MPRLSNEVTLDNWLRPLGFPGIGDSMVFSLEIAALARLVATALGTAVAPWTTFTKVTFPLIAPGIMAAALLTFALSVDAT